MNARTSFLGHATLALLTCAETTEPEEAQGRGGRGDAAPLV